MVVVWAGFLARLLFYSAVMPLWEGYDEWAHFAVVRRMAFGGQLLVPRDAPISRDVEASLELAPVPWELRSLPPPAVTEDEYWKLSPPERARRLAELRALPSSWGREDGTGPLTAYEALQPPLYYWIAVPVLWIFRGSGLLAQVLALRFCSSALASLAIPLVFLIGLEAFGDPRLALGGAAIVAVMPGLALDVARVGNDCLGVVLFTLLTWLLMRAAREVKIGFVLALGLLAKAYFLTAIPPVWVGRRFRPRLAAILVSLLVAGWWYIRNLRTTGTLSGLSESVMLRGVGIGELVHRAAGLNWVRAIDAILLSHLYFGGWSSLTVRSWMYHLFYLAILAAAVGLVRAFRQRAVPILLAVYLCFWLGQLYNVAILYLSKGLAGSMGWYMYAVVAAEVTLAIAGLRSIVPGRASRWVPAAGAGMFALLDLYTMHAVAIPYYTGMIRHRASGAMEALHWRAYEGVGAAGAVERLAVFVPPAVLAGLWLLYLLGTAGAFAGAAREGAMRARKQALPGAE